MSSGDDHKRRSVHSISPAKSTPHSRLHSDLSLFFFLSLSCSFYYCYVYFFLFFFFFLLSGREEKVLDLNEPNCTAHNREWRAETDVYHSFFFSPLLGLVALVAEVFEEAAFNQFCTISICFRMMQRWFINNYLYSFFGFFFFLFNLRLVLNHQPEETLYGRYKVLKVLFSGLRARDTLIY